MSQQRKPTSFELKRDNVAVDSAFAMEHKAHWEELPAELLMMIFKQLCSVNSQERDGFDAVKIPILMCRQLCPKWKRVMDSLLEKKSLEFWTKGNPSDPNTAVNKYAFPIIRLNGNGRSINMDDIHYPRFFQRWNYEECPIPTKSVTIVPFTRREVDKDMPYCVPSHLNFFYVYGHQLNSLTIQNIRKLHGVLLHRILNQTPNLKAITLQNVNISLPEEGYPPKLPPLTQLTHLQLWNVKGHCKTTQFEVHRWFLHPYHKQLQNINSNYSHGINYEDCPSYLSLKSLQLWNPNIYFSLLEKSNGLPALQQLYLGEMTMVKDRYCVEHVLDFLSKVKNTLEELTLDFKDGCNPPICYTVRQNYIYKWEPHLSPKIDQKFEKLKAVFIFYPKYDSEVTLVKDVLKMFPNLEYITFTRFVTEAQANAAGALVEVSMKHFAKEEYWKACPKLKTIMVKMKGFANTTFLTINTPFIF